jgi:signal transduction histidine kinase
LLVRVLTIARIRWLMAGVAFLYAVMVATLDRQLGLRLGLPWPFFVAVLPAAIAGYNALVLVALRRAGDVRLAAWVGLVGDLLAATVALEGTGGAASWLWTLFPLITLQAAFLTEDRRSTVLVAALGLMGYLVAAGLAGRGWLALSWHSRVAVAVDEMHGLEGLQASWVGIMNLLAAMAGLLALDVLARVNQRLRAAYRQLGEQYEALGQLERLKGAFLSSVSHEMRTPLAIIQGHAEVLADDARLGPVSHAAAREIEAQVQGLGAKITQVLEYTSLAGGTPLQRAPVPVLELVEAAVGAVGPECLRAGATVVAGPLPTTPTIEVDAGIVVEALRQLLRNACAASPRGGTVSITAIAVPYGTTFEVRDEGPGLPAPVRQAIGAPFTQAGLGLTEHRPGLGLGLAYTRLVASLHGGSLFVEDRTGGGTVVRLYLPG